MLFCSRKSRVEMRRVLWMSLIACGVIVVESSCGGPGTVTVQGVCSQCSAGYACPDGTTVIACGLGVYSFTGASECQNCSSGTYNDIPESAECSACPGGKFSLAAAVSCSNCTAGYWSSSNSSVCSICQAGTFSVDGSGTSSGCIACQSGSSSSVLGSSSCSGCPSGTFSASGYSSCVDCKAGYYSGLSAGSCTPCSSGFYSASDASASCSLCPSGYYSTVLNATSQQSCIACPVGLTSSGGASTCASCQVGQYINGNSECTSCPAGYFSITANSSSCDSCPSGTFAESTNSSYCSVCAAGKYSPAGSTACGCEAGMYTNSSTCVDCLAGYYSSYLASTECFQCTPGRFSKASKSSECAFCDPGTFTSSHTATVCTSCPESSTSPLGSSSISDCSCNEGYYSRVNESGFGCVKCPGATGLKCKDKWANVTQGYYWKPGKSDTFQCIPSDACQESNGVNGTICAEFYTGDNCGECVAAIAYRSSSACLRCPTGITQYFTGLFIIGALLLLCYQVSKGIESSSAQVKIVFLSIQLIAAFSSFFHGWPDVLSNFFSVLSFTVSASIELMA
jgi:hypothetical protein